MNVENWISYRYFRASKGRFLSFLYVISIAGVAIGVFALIVVTAVMTGFGNNLRDKIIGTTPHITVEKETGMQDYSAVQKDLMQVKGVVATAPYINGNIFLEEEGRALTQVIRGIDIAAEEQVTKIRQYLVQGSFQDLQTGGIMIGAELARYMGYAIGDSVTLIAPGSGIAGKGWRYKLTIVGIFKTGMADYDMSLGLVSLSKAQEIFNLKPEQVTGIGVRIEDPYRAKEVKNEIYNVLGYSFLARTWIDVNRNLFEALFLEKWGLFIILTLMVLVASFNIVSTLIVTVTSKTHDIGILKSFGMTKSAIRRIFTRQGVLIGSIGTLFGVGTGLLACYVLAHYVKVPAEIYSIEHVPVDLQLFDMMAIVAAALVISYLATIYPAAKAANLQPVEALRYE